MNGTRFWILVGWFLSLGTVQGGSFFELFWIFFAGLFLFEVSRDEPKVPQLDLSEFATKPRSWVQAEAILRLRRRLRRAHDLGRISVDLEPLEENLSQREDRLSLDFGMVGHLDVVKAEEALVERWIAKGLISAPLAGQIRSTTLLGRDQAPDMLDGVASPSLALAAPSTSPPPGAPEAVLEIGFDPSPEPGEVFAGGSIPSEERGSDLDPGDSPGSSPAPIFEIPDPEEAPAPPEPTWTAPPLNPETPRGPTLFERILAGFVDEGQIRWAEALFVLFSLLTCITGIVSVGYYWSEFSTTSRFAMVVLFAAATTFGVRGLRRIEGVEETARVAGMLSLALVPMAFGSLPFLLGPEAPLVQLLGLGSGALLILGASLFGLRGFLLGRDDPGYFAAWMGAAFGLVLLPLGLGLPTRGLFLLTGVAALLGGYGTFRQDPDSETDPALPRLARVVSPVWILGVGAATAASLLPLGPGGWCFSLAATGALLRQGAFRLGAFGALYPSVPVSLGLVGMASMGLACFGSAFSGGGFFGNAWLGACLFPTFLSGVASSVLLGGPLHALTASATGTLVAVLAAGKTYGLDSTFWLLPGAVLALLGLLLEVRAPRAARVYSGSALFLLTASVLQGFLIPVQGVRTAVLALTLVLPPLVLLKRRALLGLALFVGFDFAVVLHLALLEAAFLSQGGTGLSLAQRLGASLPIALGFALLVTWVQVRWGEALEARFPASGEPDWIQSLGVVGSWALPALAFATSGWLVRLFETVMSLSRDLWIDGPEPWLPPLWISGVLAFGLFSVAFERLEAGRRKALPLSLGAGLMVLPCFLSWGFGPNGVALGLALSGLGLGFLASAGEPAPGGARQPFEGPLAQAFLGLLALDFILVVAPDLSGFLIDPVRQVPLWGPSLGGFLFLAAALRFATRMELPEALRGAPLAMGYLAFSLSTHLGMPVRLGLVSLVGAWFTFLATRPDVRDFLSKRYGEEKAGNSLVLASLPLLLLGFFGAPAAFLQTLSGTVLDLAFGILQPAGTQHGGIAPDSGVFQLIGVGLGLVFFQAYWERAKGVSTLGAGFFAVGLTHLLERLLCPTPLLPTLTVFYAGIATLGIEFLSTWVGFPDSPRTEVRLQRGALFLVLGILSSSLWIGVHLSSTGIVFDAFQGRVAGVAYALSLLMIALGGWRRTVRLEPSGMVQMGLGLAGFFTLIGATLAGLAGAWVGLTLAYVAAGEIANSYGEGRVGGPSGARWDSPLPLMGWVFNLVALGSFLLPDLLYSQLWVGFAPLSLAWAFSSFRLSRGGPFSVHLHLGTIYFFHAAWMGLRGLPPPTRALAMGSLALVLALWGWTDAWNRTRESEALPGGGPASFGALPLVDIPLLVALLQAPYGLEVFAKVSRIPAEGWINLGTPVPMDPTLILGVPSLFALGTLFLLCRVRADYLQAFGIGYLGSLILSLSAGGGGVIVLGMFFDPTLAILLTGPCVAWIFAQAAAWNEGEGRPEIARALRAGSLMMVGLGGLSAFTQLILGGFFSGDTLARGAFAPLLTWVAFGGFAVLASVAADLARGGWSPVALLGAFHSVAAVRAALAALGLGSMLRSSFGPDLGCLAASTLLGGFLWVGVGRLKHRPVPGAATTVGLLAILGLGLGGSWLTWTEALAPAWDLWLAMAAALALGLLALQRWIPLPETPRDLALSVALCLVLGWPSVAIFASGAGLLLLAALLGAKRASWLALGMFTLAGGVGLLSILGLGLPAASREDPLLAALGLSALGLAAALEWIRQRGQKGRLSPEWDELFPEARAKLQRQVLVDLGSLFGALQAVYLLGDPCLDAIHGQARWIRWGTADPFSALFVATSAWIAVWVQPSALFRRGAGFLSVLAAMVLGHSLGTSLGEPFAKILGASFGLVGGLGAIAILATSSRKSEERIVEGVALGQLLVLARCLGVAQAAAGMGWVAAAAILPAASGLGLWWVAKRWQRVEAVVLGELLVAGTFLVLKFAGVLRGSFYGMVGLQVTGFLLLALAESVGKDTVFEAPFRRTGLALPALAVVRTVFGVHWGAFDRIGGFLLGAMAGAFYGLIGIRDNQKGLRLLGGGFAYCAIAALGFQAFDLTDPSTALDFYIVPFGLLLLGLSYSEAEWMLPGQVKTLRTVALLVVYVSPAFHAVLQGTALETVTLILLGLLGVILGWVLKLRTCQLYGGVAGVVGVFAYLWNVVRMARWNFAFLVFGVLTVVFGGTSAWARRNRRQLFEGEPEDLD